MAKKRLLLVIGGAWHPFDRCAEILKELLEDTGRYTMDITDSRDRLKRGAIRKYDAVLAYTSSGKLTKDQEHGLLDFVKAGGAFIGLHCATTVGKTNSGYVDLIGGTFVSHGPVQEFPVTITQRDHVITGRIPDFRITDELYLLDKFDPKAVDVLATAMWKGKTQPIAYTKTYGKGRMFYLALGHDERALLHPEFQKMVRRGVDWSLGKQQAKPLKVGVVGYGCQFRMGQLHLQSLRDAAGFEPVAICDRLPERRAEGKEDYPGIKTYASMKRMLDTSDVELVVVITEHNTHPRLAIQCLEAGRHVVTEKPFCITVKEADEMIRAADKNKRMLSVFHNRRWDGDYLAIKNAIAAGLLGDVFQIEACMAGYGHPSYWWRSDKRISGGAFYDWGAHIVDWVLGLVPAKITEVSGYFQPKRVWHDVTNEDHCNAAVRFENGCSATIELSHIAAIGKPRWRILGTQGALVGDGEKFRVVSHKDGIELDSQMKFFESDWHAYYRNVGDHLRLGEPLAVTPESARRVIAVIQTAEQSSKAGKALTLPKHCR
ncbi:MAG: Gfo/Idh/MocA family oxidoreductase [Nitrospiraceae bacterium]|nr:Gfo/Idh/MocA family oxidoreductase [Nitrospiraceae bacterium]